MLESSAFQGEFVWLAGTLGGSAVDYHDVRDLFEFDVEGVGLSLDEVEVAMPHEVPVALVILVAEKLHHEVSIWLQQLLCFLQRLDICEKVASTPGLRLGGRVANVRS